MAPFVNDYLASANVSRGERTLSSLALVSPAFNCAYLKKGENQHPAHLSQWPYLSATYSNWVHSHVRQAQAQAQCPHVQ